MSLTPRNLVLVGNYASRRLWRARHTVLDILSLVHVQKCLPIYFRPKAFEIICECSICFKKLN